MGIAVSLLVRPSRCLRWLQASFALPIVLVPVLAWPPDVPLAPLAVLTGLFALCHPPPHCRNGKAYRLDISDNGAIRVAVYLNHSFPSALPATLLPGAVLWSWLLVLPLRLTDGQTLRLLVLPDCVAPGAFRSLSVACRACAARDL